MEQNFQNLKTTVEKGVFSDGQEVKAVVYAFTDLGVKLAIDGVYSGLAYKNEVFEDLQIGQEVIAYIKRIRDDGKIDLSLQAREGKHVLGSAEKIFRMLKEAGGRLPFNDNSQPDAIQKHFQVSKKVFKKAIGVLYKQRRIKITAVGIEIPPQRR